MPEGEVPTARWTGIAALATLPVGLGIIFRHPPLLLVGAVGVAYAAYAKGDRAPEPKLELTRELSSETADPGDEVDVTLRIRNAGDGLVPDLRVVDGVPPALSAEGPARIGTALRSEKTATLRYTVTAIRGEHEWEPVQVLSRNASGSREREAEFEIPTTLRCEPELEATASLPLRGLTTRYAGRVATDVGGAGIEFHSTREYRHGDPVKRINWARLARTGELSTLEFREERAATVVLLVDARETAYLAPAPEKRNAVERSVDAATEAFTALSETGDRVGLAAFAPEECWVPPGTGSEHRVRVRRVLTDHPALSATPSGGRFFPALWLSRFRRRLPADAQLILFSPVADDYVVTVARRLDAYGHLVTVISPDPTLDDTPGHTLAKVERTNRLSRLREAGIRVVDWGQEPLGSDLQRAAARWTG